MRKNQECRSRKISYESKREANRARKLKNKAGVNDPGFNKLEVVYKCETCNYWHLSKLTGKQCKIEELKKQKLNEGLAKVKPDLELIELRLNYLRVKNGGK